MKKYVLLLGLMLIYTHSREQTTLFTGQCLSSVYTNPVFSAMNRGIVVKTGFQFNPADNSSAYFISNEWAIRPALSCNLMALQYINADENYTAQEIRGSAAYGLRVRRNLRIDLGIFTGLQNLRTQPGEMYHIKSGAGILFTGRKRYVGISWQPCSMNENSGVVNLQMYTFICQTGEKFSERSFAFSVMGAVHWSRGNKLPDEPTSWTYVCLNMTYGKFVFSPVGRVCEKKVSEGMRLLCQLNRQLKVYVQVVFDFNRNFQEVNIFETGLSVWLRGFKGCTRGWPSRSLGYAVF